MPQFTKGSCAYSLRRNTDLAGTLPLHSATGWRPEPTPEQRERERQTNARGNATNHEASE